MVHNIRDYGLGAYLSLNNYKIIINKNNTLSCDIVEDEFLRLQSHYKANIKPIIDEAKRIKKSITENAVQV